MEQKEEDHTAALPGAQKNEPLRVSPTSSDQLECFPRLGSSPEFIHQRLDVEITEVTHPKNVLTAQDISSTSSASDPHFLPLIRSEEIEIQKKVGNGSFSTVFFASFKGKNVAVKVPTLPPQKDSSADPIKDCKREGELLSQVKHECVLQCYGYFLTPELQAGILIEYIDHGTLNGGTLDKLLAKQTETLSWQQQWLIGWEVASGINALHLAGIVHGDVKSANVLVYRGADNLWHIKIADLGLAHSKEEQIRGGTPLWWAPEMLASETASSSIATDIYSLGLLLWSIHSRKAPFAHYKNPALFASHLVNGKKEDDGTHTFPVRPSISPTLRKEQPKYAILIQLCWEQKPENRPQNVSSIVYVLDHVKPAGP